MSQDRAPPEIESTLFEVIRQAYQDLNQRPASATDFRLDSSLDRDLGFDSLARVELILRIENAFSVRLPENTLALAETPRDLLNAVKAAGKVTSLAPAVVLERNRSEPDQGQPLDASTLLDVLDWHLQRHPNRGQIVVLSDAGEEEISYAALMREAQAVASWLQHLGVLARQAVAIMLPTCPAYFYTYFGILLSGAIPVPIYPPARPSQIEEHVKRHAFILSNAQAAVLVTVPEAMAVAHLLEAVVPGLRRVVSVIDRPGPHATRQEVAVQGTDIAFLQYTSGSTGNPKGVVLTHANLLANIRCIGEAIQITPDDVFVSWLPLYHDMGLIAAWLASLYFGNPLVVMSPMAFLARPESWLWAIHRHRGTLTAAPNFAYELCLRHIKDQQIQGLDLSHLRVAANGSEAVSPDTIARFAARFRAYGFPQTAMTPVYGLAESTVALLVPPLGRGPLVDLVDRNAFMRDRQAQIASPGDPNPLRFVACGKPIPGHHVRLVDDAGFEVGERMEGRLEFRGPSATAGYFRNPEETDRLIHGAWLDTADRAYVAAGEVYITGRVKDIIIRGGHHLYPHEIEEAVGAIGGVRKGCVAAFGSQDPSLGTERLVVLAETRETDRAARESLHAAIIRGITDLLGEPPDDVILAPPHTVLKTSSGKIRRAATRAVYEAGQVGSPSRSLWWQLARLGWMAVATQARERLTSMGRFLYGIYVVGLFLVLAPIVWLVTAVLVVPSWAWCFSHWMAKLFIRVSGISVRVNGRMPDPRRGGHILVPNHASYLDSLILLAVMRRPHRFIAKRELLGNWMARVYLQRLGSVFVERSVAQQSVADADRLAAIASDGAPLCIFPEGTFRRAPGLLAFHLGAFSTAVRAHVPILPVAIRGTRSVLADEKWLPRRFPVTVTFGDTIAAPDGPADHFLSAVLLRDQARAFILQKIDETDAAVPTL
ncbi:AMP-binding protein [Thiomonas sp. FB-Cd]|uniref:AMP-binding protein n=1 Tax=Thiomonas sp. FB-Cd TaxID=1158292 RepID=UPI0009DF29C6|nr:AMP-binding protein [Thiomonas sp. FB-Cd]